MPATYVLADSQIYLSADIHVEQNNNMLNSKVGYFKSKDEVLSFKITCLWKRFSDEHGATNFATGSYDGIRLFFEFCLSTRPICDLLYSADRQYVILNFYLQEAASIVANADAKTHYFIQFITYGLFGLMNAWVLRGYKETPQEMAQIVCDWEASSEEK